MWLCLITDRAFHCIHPSYQPFPVLSVTPWHVASFKGKSPRHGFLHTKICIVGGLRLTSLAYLRPHQPHLLPFFFKSWNKKYFLFILAFLNFGRKQIFLPPPPLRPWPHPLKIYFLVFLMIYWDFKEKYFWSYPGDILIALCLGLNFNSISRQKRFVFINGSH